MNPTITPNRSPQVNKLVRALAKAQAQFKPIRKNQTAIIYDNRDRTSRTYKYADIADIIEATRTALANNGLVITQTPTTSQAGLKLETTIYHKSGQFMSGELFLSAGGDYNGNAAHALGSQLTYLRRYGQSALLNIASEEDTDANLPAPQKPVEQTRTAPTPRKERRDDTQTQILAISDQIAAIVAPEKGSPWTAQEEKDLQLGVLKGRSLQTKATHPIEVALLRAQIADKYRGDSGWAQLVDDIIATGLDKTKLQKFHQASSKEAGQL